MSVKPTLLSAELFQYLAMRTTPEEALLAELRQQAQRDGYRMIQIAPEQGVLMQILLRLVNARRVLEVGTYFGYSAITMARVLPADGRLDSLELMPEHAAYARRWFAKAGLEERIQIHEGDATSTLKGLEAGSYDAVFIDADKANYGVYLQQALRLVRTGGLVLVDNAFAYGQLLDQAPSADDVWAIRAFNDLMSRQGDQIQSIIVPTGDGLWVGVRR
jgi:predicted O-methyltransferase YrrM